MLTNFKTIRQSIKRLTETHRDGGERRARTSAARKKRTQLRREMEKLERSLGGIKDMDCAAGRVVRHRRGPREDRDPRSARSSASRWSRWSTPTARPDGVDYVIPGNDDAMRAIQLYAVGIADAVLEGKASVPAVAVGEDEFVELDEDGNPTQEARAAASAAAAAVAQASRRAATPCRGAGVRPWRASPAEVAARLDELAAPRRRAEAGGRRGRAATRRRARRAGAVRCASATASRRGR